MAALGDPEVEVIVGVDQLDGQQVALGDDVIRVIQQIGVFWLRDFLQTLGHSIFQYVELTETGVLEDGLDWFQQRLWRNDPAAPYPRGLEDLPSRVYAERALEHAFLSDDLRQGLSQQFVEDHPFVDVVLDHQDPRELSEDFCDERELGLAEDLSHWVLGRGDDEDFGALVEGCLELAKVEVPFVILGGG